MCPSEEELFASCAVARRRLSGVERSCGAAESCQPHQLSLRYLVLCSRTSRYICLTHSFLLCVPKGCFFGSSPTLIYLIPLAHSPWNLPQSRYFEGMATGNAHFYHVCPRCVVSCEEMRCHELSWAELSWCAVMHWNSSLMKKSLPQLHEAKFNESWEVPRTPVNFCLIRFSISLVS